MSDPICMTWPMHNRCECEFHGRIVHLSPSQRDALAVLLLNRGRPVTSNHLIEALWHPDNEPDSAPFCARTFVFQLRRKLPGLIGTRSVANASRGFQGWVIEHPDTGAQRLAA